MQAERYKRKPREASRETQIKKPRLEKGEPGFKPRNSS